MNRDVLLDNAFTFGKAAHPEAPLQHCAAFANSVAYLVSGCFGGYGGPTVREHAISYAFAGEDGCNIGCVQYSDGQLARPGAWDFDEACEFAEPLCFGPITNLHRLCFREEYCFNDAPEDLIELDNYCRV